MRHGTYELITVTPSMRGCEESVRKWVPVSPSCNGADELKSSSAYVCIVWQHLGVCRMDFRQRPGTACIVCIIERQTPRAPDGERWRERQIAPEARQLRSFCFTEFVPSSSHMENECSRPYVDFDTSGSLRHPMYGIRMAKIYACPFQYI